MSTFLPEEYYIIGKIVSSHGIKGEVVVEPWTDFPERFFSMKTVIVRQNDNRTVKKIQKARKYKKKILLKFFETNDRTSAEEYRQAYLEIKKDELSILPEDTYYIFDLIGLRVIDKKGEELGFIHNVLTLPANDVYIIKNQSKEFLFPVLKKAIKKVDIEEGILVVESSDWLIES